MGSVFIPIENTNHSRLHRHLFSWKELMRSFSLINYTIFVQFIWVDPIVCHYCIRADCISSFWDIFHLQATNILSYPLIVKWSSTDAFSFILWTILFWSIVRKKCSQLTKCRFPDHTVFLPERVRALGKV